PKGSIRKPSVNRDSKGETERIRKLRSKSFMNYSSKANDSHTQSTLAPTNDMNEKTDGMSTKTSTELLKEEKHLNPQTSKKLLQYTVDERHFSTTFTKAQQKTRRNY
ncbi:unnamed protein product, partial [Didymodactylos carnosus]